MSIGCKKQDYLRELPNQRAELANEPPNRLPVHSDWLDRGNWSSERGKVIQRTAPSEG